MRLAGERGRIVHSLNDAVGLILCGASPLFVGFVFSLDLRRFGDGAVASSDLRFTTVEFIAVVSVFGRRK